MTATADSTSSLSGCFIIIEQLDYQYDQK